MAASQSEEGTSPTVPPHEDSTIDPSQAPSPKALKTLVTNTYNAIASKYLTWTEPSHSIRVSYLQQLLPHLADKPHAKVLELGCGAGVPTTQILASQPNITVTANDISSAQIALAAKNLVSSTNLVTLVDGDMMDLAFTDGAFDAVVAMYSLVHLPKDEQPVLLQRISKWLKKGGWLLVNFGAGADDGSMVSNWLGEKDAGMFWSGWGAERTCALVREAGMEIRVRDVVAQVEEDGGEKGEREVPFLWILAEKGGGIDLDR
jgi:SAM-dependent methyltransferase